MKKYLIFLLIFGNINLFAQFGFGDGTQANPYQIAHIDHLLSLKDSVNNSPEGYTNSFSYGKYFVQTADITEPVRFCIGGTINDIDGDSTLIRAFYGHFDGQGHSINLDLNGPPPMFFGASLFIIGHGAEIKNVVTVGYVNDANSAGIASMFVEMENPPPTKISNCINVAQIVGSYSACGILAAPTYDSWLMGANLTIENCVNIGNIEGGIYAGGIIARLQPTTTIRDCANNGYIKSNNNYCYVGGIAGCNSGGLIENCINNGNIQGLAHIGGIVGWYMASSEPSDIRNCINYGFIQGEQRVGGIVGRVDSPYNDNDVTVSNCINTGVITGKLETGCIVGYKGSRVTVENCHFDKQMCPGNGIDSE